jgi:uncharacterized membrane protein
MQEDLAAVALTFGILESMIPFPYRFAPSDRSRVYSRKVREVGSEQTWRTTEILVGRARRNP